MIRSFFPAVRIRVRLDGGFAHPDLLDFLDAEPKLEYVVAMASNAVLERKAEQAMQFARTIATVTGGTEHVYDDANYAAGSWPRERRVLIKAEVVLGPGQRAQRQPALRDHQYEAEPAVALRKGLLPARRYREPNQGIA
jgi:hypothetical protein